MDNAAIAVLFRSFGLRGDISWQDAEQILAEARKDASKLPNYDWAFSVLIRACETAVATKLPISFG